MDTLKLKGHSIWNGIVRGCIFSALSCSIICNDSITQPFLSLIGKFMAQISIIFTKEMI